MVTEVFAYAILRVTVNFLQASVSITENPGSTPGSGSSLSFEFWQYFTGFYLQASLQKDPPPNASVGQAGAAGGGIT